MALVSAGFFLTVTLADAGGNKSTLQYDLQSDTLGDAATDAATILAELAPITDAVVVSYRIGEKFSEDTTFYAVTGVEIENIASVVARIDAAQEKFATLKIPAPNVGIFQAANGSGYNQVDGGDADLIAYLNLFQTGANGGVANVSDGENLVSPGTAGNVRGKRIHRKSRKG